jgi:hypothetical protein
VQKCQVCGRRFDPLDFQVVIPELCRGFDRIECAQAARALASPGSRIAPAPLAAAVEAIGPAAAGPAGTLQPLAAPAATIGLLAAGTTAAVSLWLRVVGTDPAGFPFIRSDAPEAAASQRVESRVSQRTPETMAPATNPTSSPTETPRRIVITAPTAGSTTVAEPESRVEQSVLARQPSAGDRTVGQQAGGEEKNGGKSKGKDKSHTGKAKGHVKHGGSGGHGGVHSGGPGRNSGHGQENGAVHGKGRGPR